ncbi:hypothetical protein EUTSA_v10004489mg [Eutrema salsugineum]|uniref:Uncharacterized protein n=1 Tax=Eutrema salsugineum TaxID=72664 RepID=V4MMX1_EUTSA|nr:uncharacterized protein LOC18013141 [Eutrema salsugineum]XP_024006823.1 uncharacterized protein LOC18013141 [Eutrema salsugineum]ESQ32896.1 hypothetical protein EUTSA_v10004489mg [Eutrema salsugineum]
MPKERKQRSVSHEKFRGSPLYCECESSRALKPSDKQVKEWEEARCPVCMEHPHNGILLICSSYENGCRPYMCDTSHRHSNCFDQFRKASKQTPPQEETNVPTETQGVASDSTAVNLREEALPEFTVVNVREGERVAEVEGIVATEDDQEKTKPKLTCPLCRGHIKEWVVVEAARCFMNSKHRSCSSETCDFSGTYSDLRKHARLQHPGVRPSQADPERQRGWRRLERQRDLGDLLSTLQSSFGGEERSNDDGILSFDDGGWLTVFFLIRVFRPESSGSRRSSSWSGTSRARSQIGVRRRSSRLWGEGYEGDTGTSSRDEENHQSSDEQVSGTRRRRVRRRAFIDDDDDDDEEET